MKKYLNSLYNYKLLSTQENRTVKMEKTNPCSELKIWLNPKAIMEHNKPSKYLLKIFILPRAEETV